MKLAFTICSINYLANAKVLEQSMKLFNPDYKFVVGLVDKIPADFDKSLLPSCEILMLEDVPVDNFEYMLEHYNIVELNTAVKPFYFKYLLKKYSDAAFVLYIDPDIQFFNSLIDIENEFNKSDIILTPHYCYPIFDEVSSQESLRVVFGYYNGGFMGIKRSAEGIKFIDWWGLKLQKQCIEDTTKGLYVDQLWINFAPVNFNGVCNLRHLGYNMAYWNLHERTLEKNGNNYFVNKTIPLIFFHYSNFKVTDTAHSKFSYPIIRNDLTEVFQTYANKLIENGEAYFKKFNCAYVTAADKKKTFRYKLRQLLIKVTNRI